MANIIPLQLHAQISLDSLRSLSFEELLNVEVISATKFNSTVNDIPASVVIITRKEIKQFGYSSLADILEQVPGFYNIWDYTPFNTNFGIRGFWNDEWNKNIVFLVNGVPQRSPYDFNHLFETMSLPVEAIERIEIIRGPMSVNYGSGAFFGVINIITSDKGTKDKRHVFASVATQNSYKAGLQLINNQKDLQTDIIAKYSTTDGPDQDYRDMGLNRSISTLGDLEQQQTYLGFKINSGPFTAAISYDNSHNNNPIYTAPPNTGSDNEASAEISALRYALDYKYNFNNGLSINAGVSGNHFYTQHNYDVFGLDNSQEAEQNSAKSIELDISTQMQYNPRLKFILGMNFYSAYDVFANLDVPFAGLIRTSRELSSPLQVYGIYLQTQYTLNDMFTFSAGTRLEQMNSFSILIRNGIGNQYDPDSLINMQYNNETREIAREGLQSIPQLALLVRLHPNHILKFLYGEALSRPSFFNRQGINGTDLQNEKIQAFELNYMGEIYQDFSVHLNLYRNNFNNLISRTFVIDDQGYHSVRSNGGKLSTTGFEFGLRSQLQKLCLQVSGVFQETVDENHKNIKPFSSPDVLGYFKSGYCFDPVYVALIAHYVAAMESRYDFELSNPLNPDSPFNGRIGSGSDAYVTADLHLLYQPDYIKGLTFSLKINNLFDTKIYYPTSEFQPWATKGLLGPGRTVTIKTYYSF